MRRRMLKSKVHRAVVTATDLHYVGSITIDASLMARSDIREWEQVAVLDIDNGARFETYAIPGGEGELQLNGAAARLVEVGDRIIVLSYADVDDAALEGFRPTIVTVDEGNRPAGAAAWASGSDR
jgi:aspartate 1-decarboxylase